MLEVFKTILNNGTAEIVEKKSRFIANAFPIKTEEQARETVESLRKKYYDSRHNVFAYQLGEKNEQSRFSDDGEPQSTAGMPVLSVLRGEDVKNVLVVVTRYFGGTLLGTGGLVRAYSSAAKQSLLNAGICEIRRYCRFSANVNYSQSGKVQFEITSQGYLIENIVFTDSVTYFVIVPFGSQNTFTKLVENLTGGKAVIQKCDDLTGTFTGESFKICD